MAKDDLPISNLNPNGRGDAPEPPGDPSLLEIETGTLLPSKDPLGLQPHKKTPEELRDYRKISKKLVKYYEAQNQLIDLLIKPMEEWDQDDSSEDQSSAPSQPFKVKLAIYITLGSNLALFGLQITAALLSGSYSLFATAADAFMDILSTLILLITARLAGSSEVHQYPTGRGRFETIGIIVFGTVMATLSLQLILHVIESFFSDPTPPDMSLLSIIFIGIDLLAKFFLYLYCRNLVPGPTARIFAQDHRNDLFVNSIGLALGILGQRLHPLIDPIGALLISALILWSWSSTVLEHCQLVAGLCADPDFLKRITYIALTHDPRILQVDTCRAFHAGLNFIVEVDIVLPPETLLRMAHDLGESLQVKLESLPSVDRAYVHVDYESTHAPEHRRRSFVLRRRVETVEIEKENSSRV